MISHDTAVQVVFWLNIASLACSAVALFAVGMATYYLRRSRRY